MGQPITPAAFASAAPHRGDMAGPVIAVIDRLENPAASGPAMNTAPTSRRDGAVQLLVSREILAAKAAHHRQNRQSKAASLSEAELRRLNHFILRAGRK